MADETFEVLLVEDSPDDVAFFVRALKRVIPGVRLHVAADGKEALDFVFGASDHSRRHAPSCPKVIFLDLKLPKIDGLEVLRRLKSNARTQSIPVVVLSSSQEERDLVESYKIGANSYVVKPMDFDQLGDSVRLLGQYWLQLNKTP